MTNYLKQAARLKGHKNIKGRNRWRIQRNNWILKSWHDFHLRKEAFQARRVHARCWTSHFCSRWKYERVTFLFFFKPIFFIWHLTLLYSQCFQSKMWWPQWQLNWGSGNKGVVGKILLVFLGKMFNCFMDKFCDILLGQSSVTFLGHLFQYFLDKY